MVFFSFSEEGSGQGHHKAKLNRLSKSCFVSLIKRLPNFDGFLDQRAIHQRESLQCRNAAISHRSWAACRYRHQTHEDNSASSRRSSCSPAPYKAAAVGFAVEVPDHRARTSKEIVRQIGKRLAPQFQIKLSRQPKHRIAKFFCRHPAYGECHRRDCPDRSTRRSKDSEANW